MLHTVEVVLGILAAVAALALLSRKLPVPYPILLVLGGLALALIPGLPRVPLNPELVFLFFLPPLLFLAIGLVLFTTTAVAFLAHYFIEGLPLAAGFVLGAIVSPPDAIAATAIAERLRIPRRIVTILEGESLVNDATALIALRFAIVALATGTFSLGSASGQFFIVGIGGILIGLIVGWLAEQFHRRV